METWGLVYLLSMSPSHATAPKAAGLLLPVLLLLAGCSRISQQPEGVGPLRIVSTAPNLTECVCAIGAGDLLVGRTESCDYPPEELRHVPVTGGFGTPYLEPLLATHPTHVLETVLADPEIKRQLQALKVPTVHVPCTRLEEIPDALCQLGTLTGHEDQANRLAESIRTGIGLARAEASKPAHRPRVFLLFAPDTPITAGRNTFISGLLELAGGTNIGKASTIDYYHVSLEWLLQENPDIILCLFETPADEPVSRLATQTGWSSLKAVRERRVYTVRDLATVSRPGPRVLKGLAQLKEVFARDAQRRPLANERAHE